MTRSGVGTVNTLVVSKINLFIFLVELPVGIGFRYGLFTYHSIPLSSGYWRYCRVYGIPQLERSVVRQKSIVWLVEHRIQNFVSVGYDCASFVHRVEVPHRVLHTLNILWIVSLKSVIISETVESAV